MHGEGVALLLSMQDATHQLLLAENEILSPMNEPQYLCRDLIGTRS